MDFDALNNPLLISRRKLVMSAGRKSSTSAFGLILSSNGAFSYASCGQARQPIAGFDANDDVAAAPVVDIVGESANRMQAWHGIPVCLVLYSGAFHHPLAYQVVGIDRYCRVSNSIQSSATYAVPIAAPISCHFTNNDSSGYFHQIIVTQTMTSCKA
jgi:hypothetical protein